MLSLCINAKADDNIKSPPQEVTYCQLTKNPSAYLGKQVMVRAVLEYGFEIQILKSPVCCPEVEPIVGVEFSTGMNDRSEKLFHKLDKGMGVALAVFVGRFDRVSNSSSQLPSGDRFELTVDGIETVEKSVRWHRGSRPGWVPKNCPKPSPTAIH